MGRLIDILSPCAGCGRDVGRPGHRGRPRRWCEDCDPNRNRSRGKARQRTHCACGCGAKLTGRADQRWASRRCRDRAR